MAEVKCCHHVAPFRTKYRLMSSGLSIEDDCSSISYSVCMLKTPREARELLGIFVVCHLELLADNEKHES